LPNLKQLDAWLLLILAVLGCEELASMEALRCGRELDACCIAGRCGDTTSFTMLSASAPGLVSLLHHLPCSFISAMNLTLMVQDCSLRLKMWVYSSVPVSSDSSFCVYILNFVLADFILCYLFIPFPVCSSPSLLFYPSINQRVLVNRTAQLAPKQSISLFRPKTSLILVVFSVRRVYSAHEFTLDISYLAILPS
jgi:hypothetical protein